MIDQLFRKIKKIPSFVKNNNAYTVKRYLSEKKYFYKENNDEKVLKVHIIDNSPDAWILTKFSDELQKNLLEFGVQVTKSNKSDPTADINHHIIYVGINEKLNKNSTMMITHVDTKLKIERIRQQIAEGAFGICMSEEVMNKLVANGINRSSLCYINPAQDGQIKPKKFVIGITHRCYSEDFRKRDSIIVDVCKRLDPEYFSLKIMGSGWDEIVHNLRELGYEVDYHSEFNKKIYNELMCSLDFFYYDGWDEGNMGYLDALAAGITSVVTPQGYHLDMGKHTIYCKTIDDFVSYFNNCAKTRKEIHNSISDYTWEMYAFKHLQLWLYLTKKENLKELLSTTGYYNDGIHSVMLSSN